VAIFLKLSKRELLPPLSFSPLYLVLLPADMMSADEENLLDPELFGIWRASLMKKLKSSVKC